MRYVSLDEVVYLHALLIASTGGSSGIRDVPALESALAQPRMTFAGEDLYPTPADKACALGFSLIKNHPFVDGNKRIGHAAMLAFLRFESLTIRAGTDESEAVILRVAAGEIGRDEFGAWLAAHIHPL